jgi:hypothetical protein
MSVHKVKGHHVKMTLLYMSTCLKKTLELIDVLFFAYTCLVHVCNIHMLVSMCLKGIEFE